MKIDWTGLRKQVLGWAWTGLNWVHQNPFTTSAVLATAAIIVLAPHLGHTSPVGPLPAPRPDVVTTVAHGVCTPSVREQLLATYQATHQDAVKAFQASHGLTVDGVIGPATLGALLN